MLAAPVLSKCTPKLDRQLCSTGAKAGSLDKGEKGDAPVLDELRLPGVIDEEDVKEDGEDRG
jgi:hypothetical protein